MVTYRLLSLVYIHVGACLNLIWIHLILLKSGFALSGLSELGSPMITCLMPIGADDLHARQP